MMNGLIVNKVKGYRNMLGLSQTEMAKLIGISSKQVYSQKENNKNSFNDDEKKRFKEVLEQYFPDITIDDIFF